MAYFYARSMASKYKHLFFDLDHTLWDFDKNSEATLKKLYEEYDLNSQGITDFDALYRSYNMHNDALWERYRNGYIKREELRWKRMWLMLLDFQVPDSALAHEMSTAYLEILPTQTLLVPYAREVLDYCKTQYHLHLITNGFETTQRLKLQYSGISRYFNRLITSEKSNSMKPHPNIFEYALKVTEAAADESIMIGDAIDIDILGAINAGWDTVYYNPHHVVHSRKPTYEIDSLEALLRIF